VADFPTYDDLFDAGEREILTKPTSFNPTIVRTPGSDVNIAMAWSAAMAEEVARSAQLAFIETHLALATREGGETLDRWVFDRYQLTRQEPQAAVVTLQLTRTEASEGVPVEVGSVFGAGNVTFETVNDVVFSAGQAGPLSVLAVAQETGKQGNVAAGTVVDVVSTLDDSTISVTNPESAAGGSIGQTDDELAAAARDFFVNARRGTLAAILTGATSTSGVDDATAVEGLEITSGLPNFRVQLVIADSDGKANAALAQRVLENLAEYRCLGVPVSVVAGVPEFVEIRISGLQFESNTNTTNVLEETRNAILAAVNGLAPAKTLQANILETAMGQIEGLIVPKNSIIEPAGDLVPGDGGVIRTTKDRIRLNED